MQKLCEIFILCICLNLFGNFHMRCNGFDGVVVTNSGSTTATITTTTTETPKWLPMMKSKQQRSSSLDSYPPGSSLVLQAAKDLINRSTGNGNSQVLSLNLTNLLIIALLKILVFAAGLIGANHFKHYGARHQEPQHYDFHYGH